MIIKIFHIK